jgi:hypothetical protein
MEQLAKAAADPGSESRLRGDEPVRHKAHTDLSPIRGDRVQLQQVIMNLVMFLQSLIIDLLK